MLPCGCPRQVYLDTAALGQQRLRLATENAALRAVVKKVEEGATVMQVGCSNCCTIHVANAAALG